MPEKKKVINRWWSLSEQLIEIHQATNNTTLLYHIAGVIIHDGNNVAVRVAGGTMPVMRILWWIKLAEYVLQKEKI